GDRLAEALLRDRAHRARGRRQGRGGIRHGAPRADDAPGVLAIDQAACRQRRHRAHRAVAAYAAPRVRDAPFEPWRRPSRRATAARTLGHHDDDDLHPRGARAAEAAASPAPSARLIASESPASPTTLRPDVRPRSNLALAAGTRRQACWRSSSFWRRGRYGGVSLQYLRRRLPRRVRVAFARNPVVRDLRLDGADARDRS